MKIRVKTKVSLSVIVLFFFTICVYIRSGSPYSLAYQNITMLLHILMSAIIILKFLLSKSTERITSSLVFLAMLFCISVCITMIYTNEIALYKNYVIQFLMCIDAILIVGMLGVEKTIRYWIISMRTVVFAAIILYVMVALGAKSFPQIKTNAATYYTIFFASQLTATKRLSGSFWEPSMLVVFLTITLLFELMARRRSGQISKFWIFIEIVALLLTYSASAVVAMMLIGFIYFYDRSNQKNSRTLFMSTALLLCVVFMVFFEDVLMLLYKAFPEIFYKFVEKDISFLTRVNNPIGDMMTCIAHPLGVGVQNVEYTVKEYARLFTGDVRAVISRTSTWSYYFAAFGWGAGITVNLIWIIGVWKCRWLKGVQKIALGVLILYMLTSVTLISNQMYWIFIVLINLSARRSQLSIQ